MSQKNKGNGRKYNFFIDSIICKTVSATGPFIGQKFAKYAGDEIFSDIMSPNTWQSDYSAAQLYFTRPNRFTSATPKNS